jgi:uncharacterized protein
MAQVSTNAPSAQIAPAAVAPGAHIADPAPLGLACFALTTFMLSTFNAGLLPKSAEVVILGVALFYGGITQLFAGMWEFVKGNVFGALAFSSYGAFWMSLWYLFVHSGLTKADSAQGVGIFLLAWTIFTLYMTVVAARITGLLFGLFAILFVTFVFLTVGAFAAAPAITHIGGYLGLATAFVAWYASFAGVLNATAKKVVLPTWPR